MALGVRGALIAIESVQQSANSISNAYVSVLEFDAKIAEDKLQYSSWLLAVATAGFAIAVTQADKVLIGSQFKLTGNSLLVIASIIFGLSAVIGALVKKNVNKVVESYRQRMTLIIRQRVVIEADHSIVPAPDNEDIDEFVRGITTARYLPQHKRDKWREVASSGDKADADYQRLLVTQQALVGTGYLVVFLASLG